MTGRLSASTQVLDVGCGRGELLGLLKRKRGCAGVGVDFNPEVVEMVRKELGLSVLSGTLRDVACEAESADLITMTEYLEHEAEPRPVIEEARRLVKPGGFLAIEVPDITGPPGRWFRESWWQIDAPRHLTFFSPATLRSLLEASGFEVVRVNRYGMLTSMGYSLLQAMHCYYAGSNKLLYLSLSAALGIPFLPFL